MTSSSPGRAPLALWLTVAVYAGGAALVATALTLAATAFAPDAIGTAGFRTRAIDGLLHAICGAAFGATAVGRLRRDGDVTGGSRAIAAAWLALALGLGAFGGGALVDAVDWSRRTESGLPALVIVACGAIGAWLTIATAGFSAPRLAPPAAAAPPPLPADLRRLASDAMDALDLGHAALAQLAARASSPPLGREQARAAFAPGDEYARLCAKLAGTAVLGPMLEAGQALIDALRLTIVARGWPAAIEIEDPEGYVRAVATRHGLAHADPAAVAAAVREIADRSRTRARDAIDGRLPVTTGLPAGPR